ncbi:MAG TPA: HD domain-containing phosphohydrolase [bacterium]|nr:HD domain-containing phosphohydrolase [bacterium]
MRIRLSDVPTTVRGHVVGLILVYLPLAVWVLPHSRPEVVAGLTAIFALTYLVKPIPNPSGGSTFPNNSVKIVAALVWMPPEVLIGVALGSFLGLLLFRKYALWLAVMNAATWGLAAGAAALAAHWAISTAPTIADLAVAALIAVVANRVVNESTFSIYQSRRFGHPYLPTWLHNIFDQWPSQIFAAPMGIVLATLAVRTGSPLWALALTGVSAIALPIPRQELAYYHRAREMLGEIVEAVVRAMEGIDPRARAHGDRVGTLAAEIGRRLGMPEEFLRAVQLAARLHDVGILADPAGSPTLEDRAPIGGRILAQFPDPMVAKIVRGHHERWDGQGVPDRTRGNAIPLGARIIAAAEIYDCALEGLPPYEEPFSPQEAASHLLSMAGTVLDPKIVITLLRVAAEQRTDLDAAG